MREDHPHPTPCNGIRTPIPNHTNTHTKTNATQWARFVAIALIAGVSRAYLLTLNDMRVREDEHYARFLQLVEAREPGTALITVG